MELPPVPSRSFETEQEAISGASRVRLLRCPTRNLAQSLSVKKITAVKPLDGFRLWLRFSDGVEGIADLSDLADQGVFSAWNTRGLFASVKVTEYGTVAWANKIDLCQDALYLRITGKAPTEEGVAAGPAAATTILSP